MVECIGFLQQDLLLWLGQASPAQVLGTPWVTLGASKSAVRVGGIFQPGSENRLEFTV